MSVIRSDPASRQLEPPPLSAERPSRRPRPTRQPVDWPIYDARFRRLVERVHDLGPRPTTELLKELIGTDDGLRADALFLLERYAALDPEIVRALGGDTFPPTIFPVGPR